MSDTGKERTSVGFAGMTHLGIVSAAAIASKGFTTICYDPDQAITRQLAAGDLPVLEPGLGELVRSNGSLQHFTSDIAALGKCDIVYIAPDVPTDDEGHSDLSGINDLISQVSAALSPDVILVILCQVPPGFTRNLPAPVLENRFYQVETLVFGRAVERAMEPERYIIGAANPGNPLPPALSEVLGAFDCPVLPMRYESAELAKISINMCLVASISVANTLAELCEEIGAEWSEIVPSLKLDQRIGPHSYLAPGLGIAGGNLERDLSTVIRLSEKHGTDAGVIHAWIANSHHRRHWAERKIKRALLNDKPDAVIALWGLSYKENTHSIKNSPSIETIAKLPSTTILHLHDPVVKASVTNHGRAIECKTALDALNGAEALLILTPWPEYRTISIADIHAGLDGKLVLDPYGVLDAGEAEAIGLDYHTLGRPARILQG